MNTYSDLDLKQSFRYIFSIDFNPIINKLTNQMCWSKKHALEICDMYRKFLYLQKKYGNDYILPPSEDIDEFWHMHILDTKAYKKDCDAIFGHYLDHNPYIGPNENFTLKDIEKAFLKTQELYALEFNGEQIMEIRGNWAKLITFLKCFFVTKPQRSQNT